MYVAKIGDYYLSDYAVYGNVKKAKISTNFEEAVMYNNSNRAPESLIKNGFKLYKLNETEVKD